MDTRHTGRVAVALSIGVAAALPLLGWLLHPRLELLGAEHFNIAAALVAGRGFSDPWGAGTGPTAWQPPLFPVLVAALLRVLRTRARVGVALGVLTAAAHVAVGTALYRLACRHCPRLPPLLAVVLYLGWIAAFEFWFLRYTSDLWLQELIVVAILLELSASIDARCLRGWRWGALGGVAALTSPALAGGWLAATLAVWVRAGISARAWGRAGLVTLAIVVPWSARNALTFHRLIPMKSNLLYDAYLANADPDGVYDGLSFRSHPYHSPQSRLAYARLGEVGYIEAHGSALLASIRHDPLAFLAKVKNRALACTLRYVPIVNARGARAARAAARLRGLLYALPFLSLVWLFFRRAGPGLWVRACGAFYAAYLLPYVVAACYARYILALSPLLVLLPLMAVARSRVRLAALARLRRRRYRREPSGPPARRCATGI